MKLTGSLVALVTPFRDGQVDEERVGALVERQISNGSAGLVVAGTTGEASTLSDDETERLIRLVVEAANHKLPVIAGATSNDTAHAVANAQRAKRAGADMLLVASPYYNRPTPEGMYQHFKRVAAATDLPLILYNIPGRTAVNMPASLIARLAALPGIIGIKESSGNLEQASDIVAACPDDFVLISGEDSLTLPLMALGATAVISVSANIVPQHSADLVSAYLSGDVGRAREIHFQLLDLWRCLFLETNPGPLKAACQILGLCSDEVRLPLVPAGEATRERLRAALAALEQPVAAG